MPRIDTGRVSEACKSENHSLAIRGGCSESVPLESCLSTSTVYQSGHPVSKMGILCADPASSSLDFLLDSTVLPKTAREYPALRSGATTEYTNRSSTSSIGSSLNFCITPGPSNRTGSTHTAWSTDCLRPDTPGLSSFSGASAVSLCTVPDTMTTTTWFLSCRWRHGIVSRHKNERTCAALHHELAWLADTKSGTPYESNLTCAHYRAQIASVDPTIEKSNNIPHHR
jgi:hypothetical protein